jgi:hypothetical protein
MGLETSKHAAATYQPKGSYLTPSQYEDKYGKQIDDRFKGYLPVGDYLLNDEQKFRNSKIWPPIQTELDNKYAFKTALSNYQQVPPTGDQYTLKSYSDATYQPKSLMSSYATKADIDAVFNKTITYTGETYPTKGELTKTQEITGNTVKELKSYSDNTYQPKSLMGDYVTQDYLKNKYGDEIKKFTDATYQPKASYVTQGELKNFEDRYGDEIKKFTDTTYIPKAEFDSYKNIINKDFELFTRKDDFNLFAKDFERALNNVQPKGDYISSPFKPLPEGNGGYMTTSKTYDVGKALKRGDTVGNAIVSSEDYGVIALQALDGTGKGSLLYADRDEGVTLQYLSGNDEGQQTSIGVYGDRITLKGNKYCFGNTCFTEKDMQTLQQNLPRDKGVSEARGGGVVRLVASEDRGVQGGGVEPPIPSPISLISQLNLDGTWKLTTNQTLFTIQSRTGDTSKTSHPAGDITYMNIKQDKYDIIKLGSVFGLVDTTKTPREIIWSNLTNGKYVPYGDVMVEVSNSSVTPTQYLRTRNYLHY